MTAAEIAQAMQERLAAAFPGAAVEVHDESEGHRGHGGWREGGGTHWRVVLRHPDLGPLSRVARHRAVHAALGADLVGRIHALALDVG